MKSVLFLVGAFLFTNVSSAQVSQQNQTCQDAHVSYQKGGLLSVGRDLDFSEKDSVSYISGVQDPDMANGVGIDYRVDFNPSKMTIKKTLLIYDKSIKLLSLDCNQKKSQIRCMQVATRMVDHLLFMREYLVSNNVASDNQAIECAVSRIKQMQIKIINQ